MMTLPQRLASGVWVVVEVVVGVTDEIAPPYTKRIPCTTGNTTVSCEISAIGDTAKASHATCRVETLGFRIPSGMRERVGNNRLDEFRN